MYLYFDSASEMTPWDADHSIPLNWPEDERERLNPTGHEMMAYLGAWFANKYVCAGLIPISELSVLWRSSKSERAAESGVDFMAAFEAEVQRQFPEENVCTCNNNIT